MLPVLAFSRSADGHRVVVLDETGRVAPLLAARLAAAREAGSPRGDRFVLFVEEPGSDPAGRRRELDARVLAQDVDAWLWIDAEGLASNRIEYRADAVSNILTQQRLETEVAAAVRQARLQDAGYDQAEVAELVRPVKLVSVRISPAGSREQGGQAQFLLAYMLSFLLYAILAIYGVQVMQGVLEEKGSHVVELILSSVRPFDLMMGKLVGIGLVGLTQLAIWLGMLGLGTALATAGVLPLRAGLPLPVLELSFAFHFLALFVVGYFVYASFYAAIGAASSSLQDAQQFAFVAVLILLAGFMLFLPVVNAPDSRLAVVASLIPVFSPLIMMLRITVKMPPTWQIAVGYTLAVLFIVFMIWACGRIYRVGILLHGKKPTPRELWRWVRDG